MKLLLKVALKKEAVQLPDSGNFVSVEKAVGVCSASA